MAATQIIYNGSTIASLEAGQTATIKTAQSEVEYDIVVKAGSGGGSGGGDLDINGTVKQYKVEAGENVNSGDFVEFVSTLGAGQFSSNAGYVASCSISPERKIVLYTDSVAGATMAQIVDISGSITFGEPTPIIQQTANCVYIAALNSTTFIAAANLTLQAFTLDGDTITLGEAYTTAYRVDSLVGLSDNLFAISYGYKSSDNYATARIELFRFDGAYTSIGYKEIWAAANSINANYYNSCLVKLNNDYVFGVGVGTAGGSEYPVTARVFAVDETGLAQISTVTKKLTTYVNFATACKLTDEKICVVVSKGSAANGYIFYLSRPLGTSNMYMQTVSSTSNQSAVVAVSENKVLLACDSKQFSLWQVENNAITKLSDLTVDMTATANKIDFEFVSDNNVIAFVSKGHGAFMSIKTNNDVITIDEDTEAERGTFVRRATSNSHSIGIAKTSGAGGATVEVYRAV